MELEEFDQTAKTVKSAVVQCVLGNRILANEGLLDAFGHISVRNPENKNSFFQSRSLAPNLVTLNDILEIDLDGNVISSTNMKPYSERIIHAAILKSRPEVNAVFHGHPHSVIPFSSTGVPIRPIIHSACMFYDGIPMFDDYNVDSGMLITSYEEGERLAHVLGKEALAVVMRDHGCCVVGETVPQLVMASIYLRDNAEIQLRALSLGQPKYLSTEEAKQAAKIHSSDTIQKRAWDYWVMRAKKAMPDLTELYI